MPKFSRLVYLTFTIFSSFFLGRSRGERMRAWSSSPVHDGRRDLWDADESKDM